MPFFYKLYDRIKSLDINLTKGFASGEKIMKIILKDHMRAFNYSLDDKGIIILN
jgi:hypothetical protein